MFSVIGLHTFGASQTLQLSSVFYQSCVIAIPLFFMCSGFLLLGREDLDYTYSWHKIVRIVRFVFILSCMVWLITSIQKDNFVCFDFLKIFLGAFIQRSDLNICWYLGAMILIYVLLPRLNAIYGNKKQFAVFLLILFVLENVVFISNICVGGKNAEGLIPQTFRIWNWLFYFFMGGLIRVISAKSYSKFIRNKLLLILLLVLFLLNNSQQTFFLSLMRTPYCEYYYPSIVVIFLTTMLFLFFIRSSVAIKHSNIIREFSKIFLPVYVFHPFFIQHLAPVIEKLQISGHVYPFCLFGVVSICSVAFC